MSDTAKEAVAAADAAIEVQGPVPLALPLHISEEIMNRIEDASDLARIQSVCKDFWYAANNVRSLRIVWLKKYHDLARSDMDGASPRSESLGKSTVSDGGEASTSGSSQHTEGRTSHQCVSFKNQMIKILANKSCINYLRVEAEPKLQSKSVPDGERRRTDFWISDPYFLKQWLPQMKSTLQHLCIVDYGQQAIMRRSSIIKILSEHCKLMKTLDLRNMYIDTSDLEEMPQMASLTVRCVKVTGGALNDVNKSMRHLQTLALLGVFGVEEGDLNFPDMKVLCLGLSTPAKVVKMKLPKLEKLQLKMQCPELLSITAPGLKYVAFNLEVQVNSTVDLSTVDLSTVDRKCGDGQQNLGGIRGLEELLYGASSFHTLSNLVLQNPFLTKIFLDIPCMALGEDGTFMGVLEDVPWNLPNFSHLHKSKNLEILNIGPGLWYYMEKEVDSVTSEENWPSMTTLILHMIPHDLEASIRVLKMLIRNSVISLTIYIHTSSRVKCDVLRAEIEEIISGCQQITASKIETWTKNLDFTCFNF